ncbi:PAPA-1-like conserved region family protein [Pestalotiopsis sp. NC0098]|nr:PAPA-1-like conserved region family protein [Pestalotiopsis sp. NC0098]
MASRPRRAAAQKANSAITDMVDSDNIISSKTGKIMSSRAQSRRSDAKLPASKLRQSTTSRNGQSGGRESFEGGEILAGKRNRSQKKSYVVESSDDDEAADGEDEDAEAVDDTMDLGDDDAEGDVVDDSMDLDVDAEGEDDDDLSDEDAEGEEDDMTIDATPRAPSSKASKPAASKAAASKTKSAAKPALKQDVADDNSELSELDSDDEDIQEDTTMGVGDVDEDEDEDEDAEGEDDEEIEATGAAAQGADGELLSDDDGSRAASPDFAKMTKRQRARFEDDDGTLLKLSDEVQAKKHFTAEELSMRRAEMARRRRNLSEKRNEEVKRETIDKLLKKQAPKTNRKAQLAAEEAALLEEKPNPVFVRWVSNKDGERVGVPDEIMAGPAGKVFVPGGLKSGKMVEEVN